MNKETGIDSSSLVLEFGATLNSHMCEGHPLKNIQQSLHHADSLELSVDYLLAGGGNIIGDLIDQRGIRNLHIFGKQLSIASMDPVDANYLKTLKSLSDHFDVRTIGDFFAWTGVGGRHLHALMPPVLNQAMIAHLKKRIAEVQDFLGRPLVLENALTPVAFKASEFAESEFFKRLSKETGTLMALNLTTVYRNSLYQEFDPELYLSQLDWNSIYQIKISILNDELKRQIGIDSAAFDRSLWSLLGLTGRLMSSAKNKKYQVIVRDDGALGPIVLEKWLATARLMLKEAQRGTQGTSRVTTPLAAQ